MMTKETFILVIVTDTDTTSITYEYDYNYKRNVWNDDLELTYPFLAKQYEDILEVVMVYKQGDSYQMMA